MNTAGDNGATRAQLMELRKELVGQLERGEILIPVISPTQVNIAGGTNHCPNSDINYSTLAATVAGTLPTDGGDLNFEAWRIYRQFKNDPIIIDADHALKSVDHSLYGGAEGVDTFVPTWDRVGGWITIGAVNPIRQQDVVFWLRGKPMGPGQRWFVLYRLVALTADVVPADVQVAVGLWQRGAGEGWATGGPFALQFSIEGTPGATSINYRVLAKTDAGVSVLSTVLNVPNAPDFLSASDYVKLFYFAGPGFIEFEIYRERFGVFEHLFTVRNTSDFQYNDTGIVHIGGVQDWPPAPAAGDSPQAYSETRTVRVGVFNGAWALNQQSFVVPSTYDSNATDADGQFLRIQLTAPTAIDRQIAIDRIWLSTTLNEWSPDPAIKFSDETTAIPSVSPSSGNQGSGDGVYGPPIDGGGGGVPCVVSDLPVLTAGRWWRPFRFTVAGQLSRLYHRLVGEFPTPYTIAQSRKVMRSEYYLIATDNGVVEYGCSPDHRLCLDVHLKLYIRAEDVVVGETQLHSWERRWWFWSRDVLTTVTAKELVPEQCEVVDISLSHARGLCRMGEGHYVAGWSARMDRGIYSSNIKPGGNNAA